MNKKDKQFLDEIKTSLENISRDDKLPEILSPENIAEIVNNQEQSSRVRMSSRRKRITTLATCAAVAVLSLCAVFAIKAAKNPTAVVPPPSTTKVEESQYGDAPLYSVNSYSVIEQKFEKYAKSAAEEVKAYKTYDGVAVANGAKAADAESSGAEKNEAVTQATVAEASGVVEDSAERSEDYSKTNIQVKDVDEADIVKNDGKYLYIVSGDYEYVDDSAEDSKTNYGAIKIVDTSDPENLALVSSVLPAASNSEVTVDELYISGNNLIVIANCYTDDDGDDNAKGYYYWHYNFLQGN